MITTINGSRLKNTRIFVCKFQYLSVTFATVLIGIKVVEKHKMSKDQKTFISVTCATLQSISLFLPSIRKAAKLMQLMDNG